MAVVAGLILGVVMFMHAWQLFGFSAPKTTGLIGAAGATLLALLLALKPLPLLTPASASALSAAVVVWAIYAALVAGVGLWDFDARGLGFYSAFGAVVMIVQMIYSIVSAFSLAGLICGVVQFIAFAMLFFYLAIPFTVLRKATAWVLVIAGPIHGILAVLVLMGGLT